MPQKVTISKAHLARLRASKEAKENPSPAKGDSKATSMTPLPGSQPQEPFGESLLPAGTPLGSSLLSPDKESMIRSVPVRELLRHLDRDTFDRSPLVSTFEFPKVDKGGLVQQVREKQREKLAVDAELHMWAQHDGQQSATKRREMIQERQRQEQLHAELRELERQNERESQAHERELTNQKLATIKRMEEMRRKAQEEYRQKLRDDFTQAVMRKEAEKKSSSSERLANEERIRILSTKAVVRDLLEEHDYLRMKKDTEMTLRRQELSDLQTRRRAENEDERREKEFERRVCEASVKQARQEKMTRAMWLHQEGELLKQEIERRRLEKKREEQELRQAPPGSWYAQRQATPPAKSGKYIAANAQTMQSSIY